MSKFFRESSGTPFDLLPLEIQWKLFSYITLKDLASFRIVSKYCHTLIQNSNLVNFSTCKLSDSSSKFVLRSNESVRTIRVEDFLKDRTCISSTRASILGRASHLILGDKIKPANLRRVLDFFVDIRKLEFHSPDKAGIKTFFRFDRGYELVSILTLKFKVPQAIRKEDGQFLLNLSRKMRFPSLKEFNVDFGGVQEQPTEVNNGKEISSIYMMYFGVHRLLANHQATVDSICWNLSGIAIYDSVYSRDFKIFRTDYIAVKFSLRRMHSLKKVSIMRFDIEGAIYWELSSTLILAQNQLQSLSYYISQTQPILHPSASPVSRLLSMNKASLVQVTIRCPIFAIFWLRGCDSLKKLEISAWHCLRLQPSMASMNLPKGIVELTMDVKYMFADEAHNMMAWMSENLLNLERMDLSFRLMFSNPATFPKLELFPKLFTPPRLTQIQINFFAETSLDKETVAEKINQLMDICYTVKGGGLFCKKTTVFNDMNVMHYNLTVNINRKYFKGF